METVSSVVVTRITSIKERKLAMPLKGDSFRLRYNPSLLASGIIDQR